MKEIDKRLRAAALATFPHSLRVLIAFILMLALHSVAGTMLAVLFGIIYSSIIIRLAQVFPHHSLTADTLLTCLAGFGLISLSIHPAYELLMLFVLFVKIQFSASDPVRTKLYSTALFVTALAGTTLISFAPNILNFTEADNGLAYAVLLSIATVLLVFVFNSIDQGDNPSLERKRDFETQLMRRFFEEAPLVFLQLDTEGQIILANDEAKKLLIGPNNALIYPPGLAETIFESFHSNSPKDVRTKIANRYFHFVCSPLFEFEQIRLYGEDITEVELANQKVLQLTDAMDFTADGLAILNKSGDFLYTNFALKKLFHISPGKENQNWFLYFNTFWCDQFRREIFPEVQSATVWRGEVQLKTKDGFPQELALTITRLQGGNMIASVRDNNSFKQAQKEILAARDEAEKAAKVKAQFLATMSHELRTPLNGVIGMTRIMQNTPLNFEQIEIMQTLSTSGEHLMKIINEILDFTKIEEGKMLVSEETVNITKLLSEVMGIVTDSATEKNLYLRSFIAHNVPTYIQTDGDKLSRILSNLLANAVKFTAQGGIHISLESHRDLEENPMLVARIEDTGIGIPKDQLSLLFKPFSQVDSSNTRKFGGTGLGLAICKELAEMLGGTIEVASTAGIGSVFTVSIPYQTAKNPEIHEITPVNIDQNVAIEFPFQIMVAEDNIINQQLAIMTFQNMGYTIDVVNNGQEAVELTRKKTFDLIFMDIQMPVLDGVEATKIILDECVHKPVIVALTANILQETANVCIQAGMMEVIHKPFRLEAIYEILQKVGTLKDLENKRINKNPTNENWN